MAVKWLQSAVYPPPQPKLQTGLNRDEVDADYARLQAALRRNMEVRYGEASQTGLRRPLRGD
jgi:hypothetical protein